MKLLFLLFIISFISYGQDSVYTLMPVEVTGTRSTLNSFLSFVQIEKEVIQRGESGLTLSNALGGIPGLVIAARNNPSMGDKISLRGIGARASFGIRGVKILVDNIPLTMPDGQTQTNNIDFFSAGEIQVLKGPASSLYGNASGGVINVITEFPSRTLLSISPEFTAGEYGLRRYSVKLSGALNSHSYLVSFNNLNYDGYREHSSQKTFQLNALYRNQVNENVSISGIINYFNSPFLQNPSSVNKEASLNSRRSVRNFVKMQGAGEKAEQLQGGINLNITGKNIEFINTVYGVKRNLLNPIPGRIIDLDRTAGGIRSTLNHSILFSANLLNLTSGLDLEYQQDFRKEFVNEGLSRSSLSPEEIFNYLGYGNILNDQKESITGFGPFISAEYLFSGSVGLLGVLRYDNYTYKVIDNIGMNDGKKILDEISPSAGIFYIPLNNFKLFFNYSTSFQSPTASEFSNRPDGEGGFNPDLGPEKIIQYELGANYFLQFLKTLFSASIYYLDFNSLLIPYQSTISDEIFYRNAGAAKNSGFEIVSESSPVDDLKISLAYNNMKFRYEDYLISSDDGAWQLKGNYVPGIPGETFSLRVSYLPGEGFWGKLYLNRVSGYYTNDYNGPPPGNNSPENNFFNNEYFIADIRAGYSMSFSFLTAGIFTGIDNLFNKKYNASVVANAAGERYFEPAPERTIYAGVKIGI